MNLTLRHQHKPVTRFVVFHDILPEVLGRFYAHMHFLKRRANVVSLNDFMLGRLSSEKINVVITFDDGYNSWISNAIPVLKIFGFPATFFISSGFVGLSKEKEADYLRLNMYSKLGPRKLSGGLSVEDVKTIARDGFTVGGHTVNHSILSDLKDRGQLKYEIVEDKIRLENITGKRIDYFAYPSGAYHNPHINVPRVLIESGYKGAVTTLSGFNWSGTNPYLLHRELTDAGIPGVAFQARVYGNYDAVQYFKNFSRKILYK